jgi:putative transposase
VIQARQEPFFPRTRGIPRVDDRRVVSGIIYVIRNGLRWRDAPAVYGPHKTLYNRFVRWSRMGIFDRIFKRGNGSAENTMVNPDSASGICSTSRSMIASAPETNGSCVRPTAGSSKTHRPPAL